MPIRSPRYRFTTWQIAGAPAERGVYVLWEGARPIYVGAARGGEATIRSCLQDHYTRHTRPHDATHFSWEPARDPAQREAELREELNLGVRRLKAKE